jgi:hypothetical protein
MLQSTGINMYKSWTDIISKTRRARIPPHVCIFPGGFRVSMPQWTFYITFASAMLRSPPPFRYSVPIPALVKWKVEISLLLIYYIIDYFRFLREKRTVYEFYKSNVIAYSFIYEATHTYFITINSGKRMTQYLNIFLRFLNLFRGLGFYWSLIPFC